MADFTDSTTPSRINWLGNDWLRHDWLGLGVDEDHQYEDTDGVSTTFTDEAGAGTTFTDETS